jgi:HEAT repeat protein
MFLGFTGIFPFLGVIPAWIAERKGRSGLGWWLYGTTLFVVALPHALLLEDPDDDRETRDIFRKCPFCAESIRADASFCRFCKHDVPPPQRLDEYASTPFLIDALGARDDHAREKAIMLIGDRGPPAAQAAPALRRLLDDSERRIRIRAEWALERIGNDAAPPSRIDGQS